MTAESHKNRSTALGGWNPNMRKFHKRCILCPQNTKETLCLQIIIVYSKMDKSPESQKAIFLCPMHVAIWDANPKIRQEYLDAQFPNTICAECEAWFYGVNAMYLCSKCCIREG